MGKGLILLFNLVTLLEFLDYVLYILYIDTYMHIPLAHSHVSVSYICGFAASVHPRHVISMSMLHGW